MQTIQVLPEELLAAAQPLRRAAEALEDVANSRRALKHLVEASPSAALAEAFRGFLASWELNVWSAGGNAAEFADHMELVSDYYTQRDLLIAQHMPVTTPLGDMPALQDPVVHAAVPHPQPQAAPAPTP